MKKITLLVYNVYKEQIFDSQLEESVYRKYCKVVIDNNGTVEEARKQIDLAITNMENE